MTRTPDETGSRLVEAVQAAPRSQVPGRDLWPEIAGQLTPRKTGWTRSQPLIAAAVACLAIGVWLVTSWQLSPEAPGVLGRRPATRVQSMRPESPSMALIERALHDPALPPSERAVLVSNYRILDHAQGAIDHLLARHPDAPGLGGIVVQLELARARFLSVVEETQLQSNPRILP